MSQIHHSDLTKLVWVFKVLQMQEPSSDGLDLP